MATTVESSNVRPTAPGLGGAITAAPINQGALNATFKGLDKGVIKRKYAGKAAFVMGAKNRTPRRYKKPFVSRYGRWSRRTSKFVSYRRKFRRSYY